MARTLAFRHADQVFNCELNKIDRSKLYGTVDIETLDADANRCSLATLANDGKTLIPYGGTAFGYVSRDGLWVERGDLVPVDLDGEALQILPSSFDGQIELDQRVSLEHFLDHSIRLCYALDCDEGFADTLLEELAKGNIFRFDFLYRSGVSPDPAFLLGDETKGSGQSVWMLVGTPAQIDFTGLDQAAVCHTNPDADDDDDSGDFDFEML